MFRIYSAILTLLGLSAGIDMVLGGDDTNYQYAKMRSGRQLEVDIPTYAVKMLEVKRKLSFEGDGVKVCLLDGGYDQDHVDLPQARPHSPTYNYPEEASAHGSRVAGAIAAVHSSHEIGLAPEVDLIIGPKVDTTSTMGLVYAVEQCRDAGAKIVHLGHQMVQERVCDSQTNWYDASLDNQLQDLFVNHDMLLIAGAGDHGDCDTAAVTREKRFPAGYDAVMAVGAVEDSGKTTDFSARVGDNFVEIGAPGAEIWSTAMDQLYLPESSTSIAAAHVAGMAALVWGLMPWLSSQQVRERLKSHASYLPDEYVGYRLLDTGFYPIPVKRSGKCLAHGGTTAADLGSNNVQNVHLWECNGSDQQQWSYDATTKLLVSSAGLCLNRQVSMAICDKTNVEQHWDYHSVEHTLKNSNGKCLDAHGGEMFDNGGTVHLWGCHGKENQEWPMRLATGFLPLSIKSSGKCLEHPVNAVGGEGVQLWDCDDGSRTRWLYDAVTKLVMSSEGMCLQAMEIKSHGHIEVWPCDRNNLYQQWEVDASTNALKQQGHCVDANGNEVFNNGGSVVMWGSCHGNDNQNWSVRLGPDRVLLAKSQEAPHISDWASTQTSFRKGIYGAASDLSSMPVQIGNDELTGVYIPPGMAIELYQHGVTHTGGWRFLFNGGDSGKTVHLLHSYYNGGGQLKTLNDDASNYRVFEVSDDPSEKVLLCRNSGCNSGNKLWIGIGDEFTMPAVIGNDQMSGAEIPKGMSLEFFGDYNFQGWSAKYGDCDQDVTLTFEATISGFMNSPYNNAISSFKVRKLDC